MAHELFLEWIEVDADGALAPDDRERLDAHLSGCVECRAERERTRALVATLAATRVAAAPEFRARVLGSLAPAPWEARQPRAWIAPAAALVALAAGAGVLFGRAAAAVTPEARFVSALSALVDLLGASVVAGAGLLAASWRGLRLGILDAMSGHPLHWIAAAILLLGVNALAVRLLDARKRVARAERPERR